jgi:hypothetical protein
VRVTTTSFFHSSLLFDFKALQSKSLYTVWYCGRILHRTPYCKLYCPSCLQQCTIYVTVNTCLYILHTVL